MLHSEQQVHGQNERKLRKRIAPEIGRGEGTYYRGRGEGRKKGPEIEIIGSTKGKRKERIKSKRKEKILKLKANSGHIIYIKTETETKNAPCVLGMTDQLMNFEGYMWDLLFFYFHFIFILSLHCFNFNE